MQAMLYKNARIFRMGKLMKYVGLRPECNEKQPLRSERFKFYQILTGARKS